MTPRGSGLCLVAQLVSGTVPEVSSILETYFPVETQGGRVSPRAQALVTELCIIILPFIRQIFIEDLPSAKYSVRPWEHRGGLDRRGPPFSGACKL